MNQPKNPVKTGPWHAAESERRVVAPADLPQEIGRYRIDRLLGQGGFGLVYLAQDEQLSRPVAIKVPHSELVAQATEAEAYLTEARTVANLDHPNIVPVFDVGSTHQFPCYVVSKYIDGSNLKTKAKSSRLFLEECAELVATVADALHYATSRAWCIGTSSRATSCSTGAASRSWVTSGWRCGNKTWARDPATPGRPPT